MNVEFKNVSKELPDYARVRELYKKSFPREEKAPFSYLVRRARSGMADFLAIYANGAFAGLIYLIHPAGRTDPVYIFYFAVCPETRGKGVGGAALEAVGRLYPNSRWLLAIEPLDPEAANINQRRRRRDFYIRCGFHDLPWKVNEGRVVYQTMGKGKEILPEEYNVMLKDYLGWPWTWIVHSRMTLR